MKMASRRLQKLGIHVRRGLYDYELKEYARKFKISHFRDVYDRENLPHTPPLRYEAFIVNLDDVENPGTHWVAVRKIRNLVIYFDSYGDLPPPREILRYYRHYDIYFNHKNLQPDNSIICGQLCLEFLINTSSLRV